MAVVSRPVSTDFTVTFAAATTAPFGSVTFPLIWPVALWANVAPAIMAIANTTDRNPSAPVAADCLNLVLLISIPFLTVSPERELLCDREFTCGHSRRRGASRLLISDYG